MSGCLNKYIMHRNYKIFKKQNRKMWTCEVTNSYGITHVNYFDTEQDASEWVYYIWENEDNKVNSDELLSNAIAECVRKDEERGVEPNLD